MSTDDDEPIILSRYEPDSQAIPEEEWARLARERWVQLDHRPQENAPHVRKMLDRTLNIQPMKGDGRYFKVSIYHPKWVVYLKEHFRDLDDAKYAAEEMNHLILSS